MLLERCITKPHNYGGVIAMRACFLSVCLFLALAPSLAAHQSKQDVSKKYPFPASLTDPACPVGNYRDPFPHTKDLHILYLPKAASATISDPKALSLHLVFEYGFFDGDRKTIPFTRRDDGNWVATVTLEERIPTYAVYWVEDSETKHSDTNHGRYFDVRFCDIYGERSELGVKWEAKSYTGILTPYGIDRPVDFPKAIDILEEHIHAPTRGANLIDNLWRYKLSAHRDTSEARRALLIEIDKFISDHSQDGFGLADALNFVAYAEWIPPETTESLLAATEKANSDPGYSPRSFFLLARASLERDKAKRITLERELISKYPQSSESYEARRTLFFAASDLPERETLYEQLVEKNPYDIYLPVEMARFYVDANRKFPEALRLLDNAEQTLRQCSTPSDDRPYYPPQTVKTHEGSIAVTQARILLAMNNPTEALAILLPRKEEFKQPSSFFLLGEALERTGDAKGAVGPYIEAATRPGRDQEAATLALRTLWNREKMGSKKALQARMDTAIASQFTEADYAPHLLKHPAPKFDLTTLRGEQFTNSSLQGRLLILNLWAVWCGPCLSELQPLQEFQRAHPEVVVLTVVEENTDLKQLKEIIRDQKLTTLRISEAPQGFWQQFGAFGFPNTFVIDASGNVRTQHYGGIPDVQRYLTADLGAIAKSM
jgi:cytochrome c biogenesis protein CcmG/thiol:disulfide interchange protein DsbE